MPANNKAQRGVRGAGREVTVNNRKISDLYLYSTDCPGRRIFRFRSWGGL